MPTGTSPYQHATPRKVGILLINLGTPDAPTRKALRRYLREFLSDPRVIELPRWFWLPLLHGVILNLRPRASARKYASIWQAGGSPLRIHTQALTDALQQTLLQRGHADWEITCAMRYGHPSIAEAIARFREARVDRLLVLPLYPQYSAAASGSAMDGVFQQLMQERNLPQLRTIRNFHDHPAYIGALVRHIRAYWARHGEPDVLLMSFHGLPSATLQRGDPYFCECQKTGRLLTEALGLPEHRARISFQSRFGRTEWLQPYTSAVLAELGAQHTRRLDVVCPGFVADCLETLEEIAIEGRDLFIKQGGGDYHFIPCLNNNNDWVEGLADLIESQTAGWIVENQQDSQQRQRRAQALGATAQA